MPITKHYMGYYSPDEYTYECDECGCTVEEDDLIQANDKIYCQSCFKEKKKEEEVEEDE